MHFAFNISYHIQFCMLHLVMKGLLKERGKISHYPARPVGVCILYSVWVHTVRLASWGCLL